MISLSRTITILFFLLVTIGNVLLLADHGGTSVPLGSWDFIEYWTANRIALSSGNPYDAASMLNEQHSLGQSDLYPTMMWNPPWTLSLLRPLLQFQFNSSVTLWLLANITMMLATIWFSISANSRTKATAYQYALVAAAALPFFPAIHTIILGQISIFIAFSASGFYWAICKKKNFLAGIFLSLTTIKPHLLFLVFFILGIQILLNKNKNIAWGFILAFSLILASTWTSFPDSITQWLQAISGNVKDPLLVLPTQWATSSLASNIRLLILRYTGKMQDWPSTVVPLFGVLSFLAIYPSALRANWNWQNSFLPLLCFSLFTCPFTWIFDDAILLILVSALAYKIISSDLRQNQKENLLSILWLPQIVSFVSQICYPENGNIMCVIYNYGRFAWIPLIYYLIWRIVEKQTRASPSPEIAESSP